MLLLCFNLPEKWILSKIVTMTYPNGYMAFWMRNSMLCNPVDFNRKHASCHFNGYLIFWGKDKKTKKPKKPRIQFRILSKEAQSDTTPGVLTRSFWSTTATNLMSRNKFKLFFIIYGKYLVKITTEIICRKYK